MKVLILGSGAREHALAWAIARHPSVQKIYVAPGNGGIHHLGEIAENIPFKADDIDGLLKFAKENKIGLTIVGPEQPLEKGIVNRFKNHGLKIFGPSQEAAQLETSKAFAKSFMRAMHIPSAAFLVFRSHEEAAAYIEAQDEYPQVIKASGLAAGKGVVIAQNKTEALQTLDEFFNKKIFGSATETIVIESFMPGEEASVFAVTDGNNYKLLLAAQDHKRIGEGDTGKNTGGMGAYAPAPIVTPEILEKVEKEIIQPTLAGMKEREMPYQGFLYVGLMIHNGQPRVVEYNARLGDPEAQVVLPLLKTQLLDVLLAAVDERLDEINLEMLPKSATTVVMASNGYPDKYETGKVITGECHYEPSSDVAVFHAGTAQVNGTLQTSGGRVLSVTAVAETLEKSISRAYDAVAQISFDGAYFRRDIGAKGLKKS
ncbi:phosphoribosylamine/glycine ligase [Chloroherpeton thalassium ATCC 35110]|uniref:Phosphoribosylamine--glycine ligase n=1 Tax=Chloroherpeton thalassium (strain ATCC 35110 / GB-78) TaxID=517418 RepID=B3QWC5_CHLT3|nr:phosphoribosylamine--glycine ligase [Chloroherpeton thalassium]ACF13238.1 phosphoribosylamine/glycine ligase [Chloroherpeton thalassium ATCC 35110]